MLPALIIFLLTYLLMLVLPQYRPFAALGGAALFLALGAAGLWDFTLIDAARAVDFNVLLMMAGTMGTVSLFIESRMPARLAELLIVRVPNVKWAVCMLALFAGVISAFVDNVATVLMVGPCGPCHCPQAQDLPPCPSSSPLRSPPTCRELPPL